MIDLDSSTAQSNPASVNTEGTEDVGSFTNGFEASSGFEESQSVVTKPTPTRERLETKNVRYLLAY